MCTQLRRPVASLWDVPGQTATRIPACIPCAAADSRACCCVPFVLISALAGGLLQWGAAGGSGNALAAGHAGRLQQAASPHVIPVLRRTAERGPSKVLHEQPPLSSSVCWPGGRCCGGWPKAPALISLQGRLPARTSSLCCKGQQSGARPRCCMNRSPLSSSVCWPGGRCCGGWPKAPALISLQGKLPAHTSSLGCKGQQSGARLRCCMNKSPLSSSVCCPRGALLCGVAGGSGAPRSGMLGALCCAGEAGLIRSVISSTRSSACASCERCRARVQRSARYAVRARSARRTATASQLPGHHSGRAGLAWSTC